ncbi:MAG: NAD(P)-dependent glycerol-3-phosphate dehydrogenase [candidate division WOR-3 bacterium]|nr:NAD(P)-dependent glycerol-3-phosphate dehydrogenase [candidate division WOR-3 bacterium]
MNIAILGCGNWGSVFGIIQYRRGHQIKIWEFDKKRAEYIQETRDNSPFLLKYKIPDPILIDWRLENVVENSELIVFAVPCQTLGSVLKEMKKIKIKTGEFLSLIKGIDIKTLLLPSEIINRAYPKEKCYVLSGPSIANEIIRNEPTAVVLAGKNMERAKILQSELTTENLRIYLCDDMTGVEIGGALKNVIAIACGISDGLGFGANAKGALISRGIVEIQRLGVKMGANPRTFYGLSGLGDLVTTSFSEESRNHTFGKKLGQGKSLKEIKKDFVMVAEGVSTVRAVMRLAKKHGVEMPISKVVYEILYKNKSPLNGLRSLMLRPLKNE